MHDESVGLVLSEVFIAVSITSKLSIGSQDFHLDQKVSPKFRVRVSV